MRISDWSSDVCSSDLHRIERVQGFLDRRLGGAVLVPIAEAAEVVGGAVRPVELIEVDMVRLQPLQARLDRRLDVLAVEARLAATDIGEALSVDRKSTRLNSSH